MSNYGPIREIPQIQRAAAGHTIGRHWRGWPIAPRGTRFCAALVNYVTAYVVAYLLHIPTASLLGDTTVLFFIPVLIVLTGANPWGIDLGKSMCSITTVRPLLLPHGEPVLAEPGLGWTIVRGLAHVIDMMLIPIGVPMILFSSTGRSLADHIAGTIVIEDMSNGRAPRVREADPFPGTSPRDHNGGEIRGACY